MPEDKDDDSRPLNIRFPAEFWPKMNMLKTIYRTDSFSAMIRLVLTDAYDLATGNGVLSTSPLAPSVIQERKEVAKEKGIS